MLGHLKAAIKLFLMIAWLAFWFVFLAFAYKLKKYKFRDWIMSFASAGLLRIIGVRVTVTGKPSDIRPLLMASNHITYLDIWVLNACVFVHFTPKIEISKWPIIRHITKMGGSIYVDRRADKLIEAKNEVTEVLAKGAVVCLFPEATTGDGIHMKAFKSGFFSLTEHQIEGRALAVQPVAVNYTHIRRLPIDRTQWPSIAWYGDMDLMPHLWNLLKIAPVNAEVAFLEPVTVEQCGDRKKLALHCHDAIEEAIQLMRARHRHNKPKTQGFHPRFLRLRK